MKKLAFAAAAALFALPAAGHTQESIDVSASVVEALTLTAGNDLDFGTVGTGSGTASVDALGADAGTFTASGAPNTGITVDITAPASLNDGAGNSITVVSTALRGHATNVQTSSTAITDGGTVTLDAGTGEYNFWVGGEINVGAVATGTYTGTYMLTISYN